MGRKLLLSLAIVFFLSITGCKIYGIVSEDGVGVEGVDIIIKSLSTGREFYRTTNENGYYEFNSYPLVGKFEITLDTTENFCPLSSYASYSGVGFISNSVNFYLDDTTFIGAKSISTETDIDSFRDENDNCYTHITGDLIINNSSLTDLNGLQCLYEIGGDLIIQNNNNLYDLTGLEQLYTIGGNLNVTDNSELCTSDADDLEEQVDVGGTTDISGNKDCS